MWAPVIEPEIFPVQPIDAIKTLKNPVPTLIGSTVGDGATFVFSAFSGPLSAVEYDAVLTTIFRTDAPKVTAKYPALSKGSDAREALSVVS